MSSTLSTPSQAHGITRPLVRWWWLQGPFRTRDVTRQLEWFAAHGFGGVELAFVAAVWLPSAADQQRPPWLGEEWRSLVGFAKSEGDRLDLQVDITFGSSWPFGGSVVPEEDVAKTIDGPSQHCLTGSWAEPILPPVLDHLSTAAMLRYAAAMAPAFGPALGGSTSALFCDSLELDVDRIWTPALDPVFRAGHGYDLADASLADPRVRYDHLQAVAHAFQAGFVEPFVAAAHELGAVARMQCHGAPTDLVLAYATVDVPESETLLFEPTHSRIAASGAALGGRPVVTCETFTCLYGFVGRPDLTPLQYWHRERFDDLRLVADAVFAEGVNRIIWHGAPYQPEGLAVEFYASVHVAPDGDLCGPELTAFNRYLTSTSEVLQRGSPLGGVAVLLGVEDGFMGGRVPPEEQTPGAGWRFEQRHATPPSSLWGHHPMWITAPFLMAASVRDGRLEAAAMSFGALVVDVEYLEQTTLEVILDLAEEGLPVVLGRQPAPPGTLAAPGYDELIRRLRAQSHDDIVATGALPFVEATDGLGPFPFWARQVSEGMMLFLAHPACADVHFPLRYGQAEEARPTSRGLRLRAPGGAARRSRSAFRRGLLSHYSSTMTGQRSRSHSADHRPCQERVSRRRPGEQLMLDTKGSCSFEPMISLATRPVQPVWCDAPSPQPVSPLKYS